jgi:hypothetical protein
MAEPKEDKISRLLREGLDHYGLGSVAEAILIWEQILELDPDNAEAGDYLQTADRRRVPCSESSKKAQDAQSAAIATAHELIEANELESALDLLASTAEGQTFDLEIEATIELVRSCLHREYRAAVGDLSVVPVLKADSSEIVGFNLPPNACFLLSMVDGVTDLESLISLSGMDAFTAFRTAKSLIDIGIVRIQG